jgi:hypothetical protein
MTAYAAHSHDADSSVTDLPARRGAAWWAQRITLVLLGGLVGVELGVWMSGPFDLDELAEAMGIAAHPPIAVEPLPPCAAVTVVQHGSAGGRPAPGLGGQSQSPGDDAWHPLPPVTSQAAIPSVDVSVLPRAGLAARPPQRRPFRAGPRTAKASVAPHANLVEADANAVLPDTVDTLAPSHLSTALSDGLGQ